MNRHEYFKRERRRFIGAWTFNILLFILYCGIIVGFFSLVDYLLIGGTSIDK